ncbi:MAG: transposase [Bacteroidales bacterium]|nr:transposase [Bacteroidales bacterium]
MINYFKKGTTNAKAERLNGKIERFISNNYGVRDRDFVLYRIAKYFS